MNESAANASYFTFMFGDVSYAIEVTSVKEVLPYEKITPVPRAKEYMKGVMNIRGTVISVIDFRTLFGLPVKEPTKATSIIVAEVEQEDASELSFGFIADDVSGVGPLEMEPAGSGSKTPFVKMLGRTESGMVLILDMDKIFQFIEEDTEPKTK
ncbi:MAG: chemotaxis protein CheW [Treponema sp.]|nr:chemotaxis protein CheW [Candidatus Treponema caballi]